MDKIMNSYSLAASGWRYSMHFCQASKFGWVYGFPRVEAGLLPRLNSLHARSGGVLAEYGRQVPWEYNDLGPSILEEWKIEKTIWRIEIWENYLL